MKKLKDIANIQSGYTFRESLGALPSGNVQVFQAKDITSSTNSSPISISLSSDRHLLQDGDVLLSIRGSFTAKPVRTKGRKSVAASSVMIIRPYNKAVTPEYLALYLNSPRGQDQLKSAAMGAVIKSITKPELENLQIPIPPPQTQALLAKMQENLAQQTKLLHHKQQLIQQILTSATLQKAKE